MPGRGTIAIDWVLRKVRGVIRGTREWLHRHCEERSDEANPPIRYAATWIASLALAMTARPNENPLTAAGCGHCADGGSFALMCRDGRAGRHGAARSAQAPPAPDVSG